MLFDDTRYFLPPLSKEQQEKMQKVFESAKKLNSHFTITFMEKEKSPCDGYEKIPFSSEALIKSAENKEHVVVKGREGYSIQICPCGLHYKYVKVN